MNLQHEGVNTRVEGVNTPAIHKLIRMDCRFQNTRFVTFEVALVFLKMLSWAGAKAAWASAGASLPGTEMGWVQQQGAPTRWRVHGNRAPGAPIRGRHESGAVIAAVRDRVLAVADWYDESVAAGDSSWELGDGGRKEERTPSTLSDDHGSAP